LEVAERRREHNGAAASAAVVAAVAHKLSADLDNDRHNSGDADDYDDDDNNNDDNDNDDHRDAGRRVTSGVATAAADNQFLSKSRALAASRHLADAVDPQVIVLLPYVSGVSRDATETHT